MAKIVMIGSARIDENGNAHGGQAGDQRNGFEVSTQEWYKHSKGWRVFRCKDREKAEKIAKIMEWACDNDLIGYDQYQRNTLYNALKKHGFGGEPVLEKAAETDCSALVRVCLAFAGIDVPADFYTGGMAKQMLATGEIVELTGSKYTETPDCLGRGDILVTKTKGHTVVVLTDGGKYEGCIEPKSGLTVKPGTWRVRTGPGVEYPTAGFVKGGEKLAEVEPGSWATVLYNGGVRYISKNALEEGAG